MYRKVDPRIWNDAKFHSFSIEAKMIFLYILTSPRLTRIGALPMRKSSVFEEITPSPTPCATPWEAGLSELCESGVLDYDDRGLFFVRNFLKFNAPDNPSVVKGWQVDFDCLPECALLASIVDKARESCESRGKNFEAIFATLNLPKIDRVGHGVEHPVPHQEQEQKQEQEYLREDKSSLVQAADATLTLSESSKSEKKEKSIFETCPYREIIDSYHEILPMLPKVLWEVFKDNQQRKSTVKARWLWFTRTQECKTIEDGIQEFKNVFQMVRHSDFLIGEKTDWKCDFDWIMTRRNFEKILERRYLNGYKH